MEVPEIFQGKYCSQFSAEKHHSLDSNKTNGTGGGDHFIVEDLLDFSNEDTVLTDAAFDNVTRNSTESSPVTVVDSCNSSSFSGCEPNFAGDNNVCRNFSDGHFSSDLCVPYDDLAELEWLSNIVEESFSCEDLQKLQLITGMKARTNESSEAGQFQAETSLNNNDEDHNNIINGNHNHPKFNPEIAVPGKARSKRSRAAPCNWASRLMMISPTTSSSDPACPAQPGTQSKKSVKASSWKKKESGDEGNGEGRKCLHCASDKTPQWRTGPMGPKTLCNACGVRYKSGRLVPEYRPASSPTFMLTKHSNSHRKVLELRRQKEILRAQQLFMHHHHHNHQNMMFDLSNGDDFLIHRHVGPRFQ